QCAGSLCRHPRQRNQLCGRTSCSIVDRHPSRKAEKPSRHRSHRKKGSGHHHIRHRTCKGGHVIAIWRSEKTGRIHRAIRVTLADKILDFLSTLPDPGPLPKGVAVMNPFVDKKAFTLVRRFYTTFYNDNNPRTAILGINPGRFGGGITGIPFTDPIKLEKYCGIENDYEKRAELSADFIYRMIEA